MVNPNSTETISISIRMNAKPLIFGDGFQFISLGSVFSPPHRFLLL
jgi:hypothetical protein